MRRHAKADAIPPDLMAYDPQRWIRAATDADDVLVRHIPIPERATNWYMLGVIGPHYFRMALWDAVGQRRGDHYFYTVLAVQGATPGPARWAR